MSLRPWDHRRAHHPCEVSRAAPHVWGRPTVLPPCEGHSWSPTHVARRRGAGGRAGGNFARASSSKSMLTPQPFSSSLGRTVSLSAWPLSVLYARLGRGRGSAHPTFSPRPHRWVLRAARLQPQKRTPALGTVTSACIMMAPPESRSRHSEAPGYPHFSGRPHGL